MLNWLEDPWVEAIYLAPSPLLPDCTCLDSEHWHWHSRSQQLRRCGIHPDPRKIREILADK